MATRSKPAPDIYLKACELLGESPRITQALEDSRNGLWAAHNAGCRVIVPTSLGDWGDRSLYSKEKFTNLLEVKLPCARMNNKNAQIIYRILPTVFGGWIFLR